MDIASYGSGPRFKQDTCQSAPQVCGLLHVTIPDSPRYTASPDSPRDDAASLQCTLSRIRVSGWHYYCVTAFKLLATLVKESDPNLVHVYEGVGIAAIQGALDQELHLEARDLKQAGLMLRRLQAYESSEPKLGHVDQVALDQELHDVKQM